MRMKNSLRETCELHVEVQNKSQMSTEYSRLEYYLLLCYVYIISINILFCFNTYMFFSVKINKKAFV